MKAIRLGQFLALFVVGFFVYMVVAAIIQEGDVGGIYGNPLAPIWIFSPAFFGLALLGFPFRPVAAERRHKMQTNAGCFLLASLITAIVWVYVHLTLKGTADAVVSFALFMLAAPFVFYIVYGVSWLVTHRWKTRKR